MTTTSDDMVERVARAILKARYYDCEPGMYGNDVGVFFAGIDRDLVRDAEYEARAAIEAMQPAILAEREQCAKIADESASWIMKYQTIISCPSHNVLDEKRSLSVFAKRIAAAIRDQS